MFAFPPGWQPAPCSWECPETHLTFQHPVLACLSVGASWRHGGGGCARRKLEITFPVATFLAWSQAGIWMASIWFTEIIIVSSSMRV